MYDELDYKIIQALNENGRASASEIARCLNAKPRTIRKRIEHLLESGAFHPTIVINPEEFGYNTSADIFIRVEPEFEQRVIEEICAMPEISYIAFSLGSHDISLEARLKTNGELYDFVRERIGKMPGVTVSRFVLVPRILKNAHEWLPKPEDFLT